MFKLQRLLICAMVISTLVCFAQEQDNSIKIPQDGEVPGFTMPNPLIMANGDVVDSIVMWDEQRRPEIMALFETQVYGKTVGGKLPVRAEVTSTNPHALDGKALRREITLYLTEDKLGPKIDLLIYQPNNTESPVPVFMGLNFRGNHATVYDEDVKISEQRLQDIKDKKPTRKKVKPDTSRGSAAHRWPMPTIVERGYAIITVYYGDLDPDYSGNFSNGIHPLFYKDGQEHPEPDEWGAIGAWAWGLSHIMDYIETDASFDNSKVAVMGHSRLGKTSLWAGAQDERFAVVISNNSGCGGASLSRRKYGEKVAIMNRIYPHWFNDNFLQYNNNEQALPVDQHMLMALIAPRPLYIASAEQDHWADPKGEFLSAWYASPVYELLGEQGIPTDTMPELHQPTGGTIAYHIRAGKHDVTDYDWEQYLNFADKHLGK